MRRREFVAGLGSAAAWPMVARAQQAAMPVIGILLITSPDGSLGFIGLDAIRRGLGETGYVEGQNVAIEYRWAENNIDRLPALADDLAHRQVSVLLALGGDESAMAAKAATASIPIVFAAPRNPVELGLVASLNRPGANLTGVTGFTDELLGKRLQVLHELVPDATVIAHVVTSPGLADSLVARAAAAALGLQIQVIVADTEREIELAFAKLDDPKATAVLLNGASPYFDWRWQIVDLAARYRMPVSYHRQEFVEIGGLVSYGVDFVESYRQAGIYVGRILKGEKPSDLPVMQSTKIDLVINNKTAKALGLRIPTTLLVSASEVIE